jgi:hypothetical protein
MNALHTPVVLTLWNQPQSIRRIMEVLKKVKPRVLYLISDAPRNESEKKLISESRQIAQNPEWKCRVITDYSKKNQGPKYRVSSGITTFFQQFDTGIVLEHDCLPDISFFKFCEFLLNRYENNEKVMHISGNNFQPSERTYQGSYYFSRIPHIWGFATWKRAWKTYQVEITDLNKFKQEHIIQEIFTNKLAQLYWLDIFSKMAKNKINTWDFQWTYTIFKNNGLCINPSKNLVTNIGFGPQAANTINPNHPFANLPLESISDIVDPPSLHVNSIADSWTMKNNFEATPFSMVVKPVINRLSGIYLMLTNYKKYQQLKSS